MKKVLIFVLSMTVMTSCYTTWTTIGNYEQLEKQGLKSYQYDQKKQFYLFEVLPLGHSHAKTPNEPCEVISKFKFIDFVIPTITCGVLGSRTVIVNALEGGSNYSLEEPVVVTKEEKVAKPSKSKMTSKESASAVEVEQEEVASPMKKQEEKITQITPSTSSMVTMTQNLKIGDRVVYKLKGQWWYYATITVISGDTVTLELQNGVVTERTVSDVMKVEYLR